MHERVWIHTHTRIKIGWRKRRRICTTYPFVTYIRIPSPYTARLSRCLLGCTEIKSLELRPEGACNQTWYRCLNKTTMCKGTFSELGSAQRCHRLVYEKYNFSRKGSVFQVLMEKNHSMFRVVTHSLGAFRRPFFSSIGTQLPPPPPPSTHTPGTEVCIETFERITICVWRRGDGGGGGGRAFLKKIKRNLGVRVHAFFFFFFFWFCFFFVVVREREKDIDREKYDKREGKKREKKSL